MLNKTESDLLQYILENSPDPNVQTYVEVPATDTAAVDRLVHLGLVVKKGWCPVMYQITDAGRHFFRDEAERQLGEKAKLQKDRREKILIAAISAIFGSLATLLVTWLTKL